MRLAVGCHAKIIVEKGGDVKAEIGGIDEDQHLKSLWVFHPEVPFLQGRYFFLETGDEHAGHSL